jgi:hypothetical protein
MNFFKSPIFLTMGMLLTCLVFSCTSNTNDKGVDVSKIKKVKIDNGNAKHLFIVDSLLDSTKIIPLETTNESLVGKIDELFFIDSKIIAVDKYNTKSVFIFSSEGKFLNKIYKKGKGRGEFLSLRDALVTDSGIEVFDEVLSKILRFNFDGTFVSEIPLTAFSKSKFAKLANGEYLFFNINVPTVFGNHKLYEWDVEKKALRNAYLPFDDLLTTNKRIEPAMPFNDGFYNGAKAIKFNEMYNDTVYAYANHNLIADYVFDFAVNPLPKNFSNDYQISNKMTTATDENYAHYYGGYCEMKDYILFNYNFNDRVFNVLWEKRKKEVTINSMLWGINNYDILLPYNWFKGHQPNSIAVSYEPQELLNWIKSHKTIMKRIDKTDLYKKAVKVNQNDNPVLLIMNFKKPSK